MTRAYYQERPTPNPAGFNPPQVVDVDNSAVTKASDQLGKTLESASDVISRVQNSNERFNYENAKSAFLRKNVELQNQVANDPDYTNIGKNYQQASDQIRTDILSSLGNNRYASRLNNDILLHQSDSLKQLNQITVQKQGQAIRGDLTDTINSNQQALLQTPSEKQKASLINSTNEMINSALATGAINPEEANKTRANFVDDYATNRLGLLNPYQQIAQLNPKRTSSGDIFFPKMNTYVDFLSPEKKVRFYEDAKEEINKKKEKEIDTTMVNLALQGKLVLDPTLPENQKALDVVWSDRQQNLINQGASKEQILNSSLDIVSKLGIIPSPVKSVLTANVLNGDVNQKATYSKYIGDAAEANPKVLNSLDRQTASTALAISDNLRAGLSSQQAVEWVNDYQDQAKKESIETKSKNWESLNKSSFNKNDQKLVKTLQDQPGINFWWEKAPQVPSAMVDDYKRLAKGFYVNNNLDNNSANKSAERMVRATWGVTDIGGTKQYMKYAPEAVYGNQDDWLHKQLESDFKTPIKDLSLEVDYSTINSNNPNYFVYKKNESGGTDVVLDDKNMPKKFIPSSHQANTDQIREDLRKAQDERERALMDQKMQELVPLGR